MLYFFETLIVDMLAISPEFFLLIGAHELPRPRPLVTVRRAGAPTILVET